MCFDEMQRRRELDHNVDITVSLLTLFDDK